MCGILGTNFLNERFDKSLELLHHRGPDFQNSIKIGNKQFGHTRLAIIDLDEEANQPMIFDDILLVFNGEIYNYKELIHVEHLECKTKSDSEVLIRLYQKYGFDFLNKLNGMFSFCIYDMKKDLYFCARDRYGKKPFFYYFKDNKFIFSSSVKSILNLLDYKPNLNKVALSKYMQYFVSFGEDSFYQDIFKLEASTYLIYESNKSRELQKKKYYKINTYKAIKDEKQALNDIEELLFKSVEYRLNSDVEVASLLSGGIDSSLISALYTKISGKKINTFSIGYDEYKNYCELNFAQITASHINSNHHPVEINQKEYINHFEQTLDMLEEPHGDSAAIPLNILTKQINKAGIKTVLSGEGSDEIFLGYDNYAKFLKYYEFEKSLSNEQNLFLNDIIGALQNNTKESEYLRRIVKKQNLYNSFGEIYTDIQRKRLFKKVPTYKTETAKQDPVDWMSYIDLKIWLGESLLSKVDRISMGNSLEVRTPFLDFNLVNYMFSVESDIKVGDTNKYLLKKIASKYIPNTIINRTKKGFNSPFNEWLNKEYGDKVLDVIVEVNNSTNLFNHEYILHIYELSKSNKFKQHLYSLFVFSLWYKKEYL
ncbi:asparagine synthase (glutamine-hydrolyzing) [Aliarcobacter butzleri]|uniref:asparagine synthase (glutamine-hydrolyzing) n=1 Tax=Aliarcobacter butzleri TaxID=28197 RepID=UPI0021B2E34A|nr:asparagine synthase (glutamine-hydrolyzing) [Aliarcobacter butzleri]MCT7574045.1 asparagine synthase (glutamine-hydrolyzing) [Aliarcobacter butzleri]MCT7611609.1 asparagine synthase (glutamine-hydrolyzing) [Aliarcobacter butzleri]MCT7640428.1 asparagine synthase (glutamine-hydrolyzing) [Aliarcobacter butzleri]MDK2080271.1 asparagine synthase (glutamine-hydrolyzing) [Aliarcobacter butzleri]MDK2083055.1 asparagine synthase (glutamine-hydrolyzing) [Aliarcobacter butzleri]